MTALSARLRRDVSDRRDEGVTLPELIVTMMIFSIITTLIMGFVVVMSRTFSRDREQADSANVASVGMNEVSRVIRSATELRISSGGTTAEPVFIEAAPNTMTLYSYIDSGVSSVKPIKVQFSIDAQRRLVEKRWNVTNSSSPWTFATAASSTRTIARSIPVGAPNLFTYVDKDSVTLPFTSGVLSATNRQNVAAVRVTLTVQSDLTSRADPVEVRSTIGIPNLGKTRVRP
ncbi:PulJ/GspJ family protein [Cellulomonas massiliensis]|uniref:PulJ/GspJ family protein n=1 Tax=Cellulomonas massiliensis TaxID=1465811 RepID=UPI000314F8A3|nr:type II secretion system protein [Cellulomonas massiliensis]